MKTSAKVRLGLAAATGAALVLAAVPASASTGVGVFTTGHGAMSPGLTTLQGAQWFTFSGSGRFVADTYQGPFSCNADGNEPIGTITQGAGTFAGDCFFGSADEPISGSYTRDGNTVMFTAMIGPGPVSGALTGNCVFPVTGSPTEVLDEFGCWFAVQP